MHIIAYVHLQECLFTRMPTPKYVLLQMCIIVAQTDDPDALSPSSLSSQTEN